MKLWIVVFLGLIVSACNSTKPEAKVIIPSLPQQCGKYIVLQGFIENNTTLKLFDGEKIEFGKSIGYHSVNIDFNTESYIGKRVIIGMGYWSQTIGGLLNPDGSSSGIYTLTHKDIKLLQLVEHNRVDIEKFNEKCSVLKNL